MVKEQMAFVVSCVGTREKDNNVSELNKLLSNGWHVATTCPLSPGDGYTAYALVILEKE